MRTYSGAASSLLLIATTAMAGLPAAAHAQDAVARFYKDKSLTVVIGSSAGGGVDTYGRLVARYIGNHIPGNPRIVAQNMPGAGSVQAMAYIYASAPKDGTQIGISLGGAVLDPLLNGSKRYDPTRLAFIGNANLETQVCVVRTDAPVRRFADAFATELIVGGTGPGSTITDYPVFLRNFFKTKVRLVSGYPGSREVALAVHKGEVHGTCGLAWSSAKIEYPDVLEGKSMHVILQEDLKGNPVLNAKGVPLVTDFVKSPEDRPVVDAFYVQSQINRVFFAPPGTPPDRVEAVRTAFMAAFTDKELQAEADKMHIDVVPTSGAEVQALVDRVYATPPAVVDRMKRAMGSSGD